MKIENYTLYGSDRRDGTHGGVVLYPRDDTASGANVLRSHSDGTNELLIVQVPIVNIVVVTVFRPPYNDRKKLSSILAKISENLEERDT